MTKQTIQNSRGSVVVWLLIVVAILATTAVTAYYFLYANNVNQKDETGTIQPSTRQKPATSVSNDAAEKNTVSIQNYAFFPETITVKTGEAVSWRNADNARHSATADDQSFDTGVFDQGTTETVTFDKPGTYAYHCSLHPKMKGTIVVE